MRNRASVLTTAWRAHPGWSAKAISKHRPRIRLQRRKSLRSLRYPNHRGELFAQHLLWLFALKVNLDICTTFTLAICTEGQFGYLQWRLIWLFAHIFRTTSSAGSLASKANTTASSKKTIRWDHPANMTRFEAVAFFRWVNSMSADFERLDDTFLFLWILKSYFEFHNCLTYFLLLAGLLHSIWLFIWYQGI